MRNAVPYGVARAEHWVDAGVTRQQLRTLADAGRLTRPRYGWYAAPDAEPQAVRAVALGGTLACVSALRLHGLWVPPGNELHVRFADRRRRARGATVCRAWPGLSGAGSVDPLGPALVAAGRCVTPEQFVAILDSATHRLGVGRLELEALIARAPRRVHRLLDRCAPAESGTESLTRFRLTSRGIRVTPQVVIATVGRVDFLVGRRLVIEVDSVAHHTSREAYTRDRERDRRLVALGYIVVRLTYHQVMHDWDRVEPDLLAIIRRGDHRPAPKPAPETARGCRYDIGAA